MLSGIQHFRFCSRQWALIDMEQLWQDNYLTIEGEILHQHVDDPFYRQKCGDNIALRSVSVASHKLGLYGIADVVELVPSCNEKDSITHPRYPGYWTLIPIEYKHGKPKKDLSDEMQLTAQAICLEEMHNIHIERGAFFYAQIRRRVDVVFTRELRDLVEQCAEDMHFLMEKKTIPSAVYEKKCKNCSLVDLCLPRISDCGSVRAYLDNNLLQ